MDVSFSGRLEVDLPYDGGAKRKRGGIGSAKKKKLEVDIGRLALEMVHATKCNERTHSNNVEMGMRKLLRDYKKVAFPMSRMADPYEAITVILECIDSLAKYGVRGATSVYSKYVDGKRHPPENTEVQRKVLMLEEGQTIKGVTK
jgi:hypothetical protein